MNYIDLFHGIGGFALGAHWAGMKFENHFCSDIEPYCQKLYKLRFPDSIQIGDITKIDTEELKEYGTDWIITGGFPCQDISIAGKGVGIHGSRSGLWFEYWRLIRDLRPRFAIMENVGMLVHRGLREVLGSLAEIGYDAEWQDIRASDVGAPHRRERIWIVAYPKSERGRDIGKNPANGQGWKGGNELEKDYKNAGYVADTGLSESSRRNEATQRGEGKTCRQSASCGTISYTTMQRLEKQELQQGLYVMEQKIYIPGERELPDADNPRLQGRTETRDTHEEPENREQFAKRQSELNAEHYWSVETDVGRLVNGLPGRVDRLKGLGNAIVPQIAELLFRQIKQFIQE